MKKKNLVFLICFLSYTAIYVARLNLSMASPGLKAGEVVGTAEIGLLGSAFSVVYAIGRMINGIISDRVPPRRMIAGGLLLGGVANLLFSFFPPFFALFFLWSVNAFAQSMLWSAILRLIAALYDGETAKRKVSYMVTAVAVGNIAGILCNTGIINAFGLSFAFLIPGGILLLFAVPVFLFCGVKEGELTENGQKPASFFSVLAAVPVRQMLLPAFFHGIMKDNISIWMTVYVVDEFGIKLGNSALYILLIPTIGLIARLLYPLIYRLLRSSENSVSVFGFAVCLLASLPLLFGAPSPLVAVLCLSLIYAAVSLINTSVLSIFPIRFSKSGNVSSVSGLMDFATYLGAGAGSLLYGFMIDRAGYGSMFLSWAVVSLFSFLWLIFLLKRAKKKAV